MLPNEPSESYRQEIRQYYKRFRDSLHSFDRTSLPDQQQVSYDILEHETSLRLELLEFPYHLMPVHQFRGLTLTMPMLGSGKSFQPFKTVKDYDDFLKRIDWFAVWVDNAIVNMRKGLAGGYTFPKILMERGRRQKT